MNAVQRAGIRLTDRPADRLPQARTARQKARHILGWLRDWLWRLFDRLVKAFFDALLDHLRKV
jgi:hypothetical protein